MIENTLMQIIKTGIKQLRTWFGRYITIYRAFAHKRICFALKYRD